MKKPVRRQRPSRLAHAGDLLWSEDDQSDDVPTVQDCPRQRRLIDDSTMQEGLGAIRIRALARQPEIVPTQPCVERLQSTKIRDRYLTRSGLSQIIFTRIDATNSCCIGLRGRERDRS